MMTAEDYIEGKAEAAPISTYHASRRRSLNEMGVSADAVSEAKAKQVQIGQGHRGRVQRRTS